MAFNQGPQPQVQDMGNGVRYVDPNPTDEIVNHEDLVMYVKLVARAKGRSILTYDQDTEQQTVIVEQKNVQSETNFTYQTGKEYLDTSWTNIGGGNINFGEDLGSFGITNIGIEFKSSFMPQIVIDFVDVRGAALFEQGPCSPYAIFFHLPYPVFELTVKGYYGRPVTYTLALIKFNTKFNSETGNFESKAEFVGYTYAFLADIPMGYVMAANFMTKPHDGKTILAEKWKQLIEKKILDNSFTNENEPLSVYDLIKKSKQLEQRTQELKGLASVKQLGQINSTKNQLDSLRNIVSEFEGKLRGEISNSSNSGFENKIFFIKLPNNNNNQQNAILEKVKAIVTEYLGDGTTLGGKIGTEVSTVNTYYTTNSIGDSPNINRDNIRTNTKGFLGEAVGQENGLSIYSIDFNESFYKPLNIATKSLSKQQITKKDLVKKELNAEVIKTLGFLPTISNVFAIILTNVEVFLELLLRTSRDAEKYHEDNDVTSVLDGTTQNLLELRNKPTVGAQLSDEASTNKPIKVYPWPTYYVQKAPASETNPDSNVSSNSSEVGTKEAYPGENPEFTSWPEVVFVENFIKALTRLKTELQVLELEKENLPGYDNFAPITAYETHAFGNANAPNRWYRLQQDPSFENIIYKIMGENAFILGDYTMINTLSLWKSQLGFTNGWGVSSLTNYQGSGNGYIPASSNGFNVGPQRLVNNPLVISNLNQPELNRYPNISNKGFNYLSYGSDAKDREVESFRKKIIPTTRARMKKWGYIDALNLMTTMKLDGGETTVLSFLKSSMTVENKEKIKKEIKERLSERLKTQTWDEWKVSATQEISGTTALIDNQNSIWSGHFGYVKKKPVLSYKGPIILNSQIDEGKNIEIHANPHLNEGQGAILTTADALAGREIDFSSESLTDNIKKKYTEYFADVSTNESKINEDVATPNSLAYTTLKYRPKPSTIKSKTSYDNYSLERSNINLIRDKNTNLLSLGENFYPNFFHKYEDNEGLESSKIILDLSSSRRYISQKNGNTTEKWARFMGAPETDDLGFANSIINTPLWTLNYPLYKNAWNWSKAGGNSYIGLDETIKTSDLDLPESYNNNIYKNTKRNWGTWWGINQWGVDNNTDYYKPLAYIAVMSFGFRNQNTNYRSGHFLPWDGKGDYDLSSFSNFTHTAIVANLPKSYVLLIGALLWRMKESGLLRWDDIKPKRNTIDANNKGWNTFDKSYLGAEGAGNVGIDDLNDPVWFFHTSTSRPLYGGGSVYANNDGFDIKQSPFTDGKGKYQREWLGRTKGIDNWTNGGGSINSSLSLDAPVTITSWTKGQFVFGDEKSEFKNRARGFYDLCRPDQIPFLISSGDDFKTPNTLAIVEKTEKDKNPPSNVNTSLSRLPNLKFDNGTGSTSYIKTTYPVLKEECKELMFIPKSLKEQFIQAFENWATNDTKWLATIDPLNWTDDGKLENFTTTTNGNVNTAYKVSGYRGFLNQETYSKSRNFGKVINDEKKDFGFSKFDFEDNNNIGSNQKKTKKTNKNNNSSEENIPSGGGSEGIEQAGGIGNSFCFVAGTKIKLVDGSSVNIEDLNIDKKLLTYNLDTKEFEEGDIGEIQVEYKENLVTYYFDNGNKINCTEDHPIWVIGKGWSSYRAYNFTEDNTHNINTKEIIIGDECLYYSDGKFNKVKLNKIIRKNNRPTRVWRIKNLNVNKNFIAGNVLVYN